MSVQCDLYLRRGFDTNVHTDGCLHLEVFPSKAMFFALSLGGGETVQSMGKFGSLKLEKNEVAQMNIIFSVGGYSLSPEWGC